MCRDLCFHVKEQRYNLNQIKNILDGFQMEFLGFILDHSIKEQYSKKFIADENMIDLEYWNKFEELNPNTFRQMYQFWVNISD